MGPAGFALVALVIALAFALLRWYQLDRRITRSGIPTTYVSPLKMLRGDFMGILNDVTEFLDSCGGVGALRSPAGKPFVIANDPTALRKILTGVPQRKLHANGVQNPLVGRFAPNLLKMERKVSSAIDDTSTELHAVLGDLFQGFLELEARRSKDESIEGRAHDMAESIREFWWHIRLCILFGHPHWDETTLQYCKTRFYAEVDQFASIIINMIPIAKYFPLPSTIWYRFTVWRLRNQLRLLIEEFEATMRGKETGKWAMLHHLSPQDSMDLKVDVCMKMLFVGIGPLTDTVCWMVWHIAHDIDLQEAIRSEVDNQKLEDNLRAMTSQQRLPMLDAVYKETLRMYAPVHVGRLTLVAQDLHGYPIPRDSDFMTNMHFVHRSKKHFKKPNDFDASRWLSGNREGLASDDASDRTYKLENKGGNKEFNGACTDDVNGKEKPYYPFSIGARSCPGSQISACVAKYFIVKMLKDYKLGIASSTRTGTNKNKPSKIGYNLVMPIRPSGMHLTLQRRPATAS